MKPVAIQGIGAVGGFGCGVEALAAALTAGGGKPAVAAFEAEGATHRLPAYLADPARLTDFLPARATRRVDRFSRLALLGAHLALEDAGLPAFAPGRLGVVVCSGYGAAETTFRFLDSILDDGDACASPTRFSNSVHNAAAAHLSILMQITGPSLTVSQFELSFASGLLTATQWLAEGRVDAVLCGGVDEFGGVLGYCWERFFGHGPLPEPSGGSGRGAGLAAGRNPVLPVPNEASTRDAEPRGGPWGPVPQPPAHRQAGSAPFAWSLAEQTAIPGEGAAFFLLGAAAGGARRGWITEVELGRAGNRPVGTTSPGELLVLGADGHAASSAQYAAALPPGARPVSFAACYGSFPAAGAFDVAAAALHLAGESPEAAACCLKMNGYGGYGRVRLGVGRG